MTHGLSNTKLYTVWRNMKSRCYYKNNSEYHNYGGRGIEICLEWLNNFKAFYDWAIANGYETNLTIERKNVNGNYCPENCEWIPKIEQAKNKTNNVKVTAFNETKNVSDWGKDNKCKVSRRQLGVRIKKGIDPELALLKPSRNKNKRKSELIEAFGEKKIISEWLKDSRCTASSDALRKRLKKGVFPEIAMKALPKNARLTNKKLNEALNEGN